MTVIVLYNLSRIKQSIERSIKLFKYQSINHWIVTYHKIWNKPLLLIDQSFKVKIKESDVTMFCLVFSREFLGKHPTLVLAGEIET